MIEALKSDEIVNKVGGRFKLTALIQKRMLELMDGARPLVERGNMTDLEVVIQEILQDKIAIDYEASGLAAGPNEVNRIAHVSRIPQVACRPRQCGIAAPGCVASIPDRIFHPSRDGRSSSASAEASRPTRLPTW